MNKKAGKIAGVLAIPLLLFVVFSLAAPGFGLHSIQVIAAQAVIPTIMGYGMAFGMAAGLFDLSTGSRVIAAASMGGFCANYWGLPGLIIGSIAGGVLIGAVMGGAFEVLKIPSLVLSLGAVMLLEVFCYLFLGDNSFVQISNEVAILGKTPWSYIICILLAVVFYVLYYRTRFSYHVRTIGNNEILARNMGISPRKVNFLTFLVGGIFIGIVGILQISYSNSISGGISMSSLSMVFKPMMGVMIGMELLALVDNLALNIIIGELCISMIFTGLIALGLPSTMQDVVLGIFMIIVMAVSANRDKLQHALTRRKSCSNIV